MAPDGRVWLYFLQMGVRAPWRSQKARALPWRRMRGSPREPQGSVEEEVQEHDVSAPSEVAVVNSTELSSSSLRGAV